jgi:hypothetical protein
MLIESVSALLIWDKVPDGFKKMGNSDPTPLKGIYTDSYILDKQLVM